MTKIFAGAAAAGLLFGAFHVVSQPCVSESGPGPCYWDAQERGNHEGKSFVMIHEDWIVHLPVF